MTPRLDIFAAAPKAAQSLLAFSMAVEKNGIEKSLAELVKLRASQINGCGYCLHMHAKDARAIGETEERIYMLDAWRETPIYNARERAALAWTETLTYLCDTRNAPDEVYAAMQAEFTEEELVNLTMLIVAINGWNRVNVGFRAIHPDLQAAA